MPRGVVPGRGRRVCLGAYPVVPGAQPERAAQALLVPVGSKDREHALDDGRRLVRPGRLAELEAQELVLD